MKKRQPALEITQEAEDTTVIESEVEGVKNSGARTSIIKSKIYWIKKKHPFWFWLGVTASTVTVLTYVLNLLNNGF